MAPIGGRYVRFRSQTENAEPQSHAAQWLVLSVKARGVTVREAIPAEAAAHPTTPIPFGCVDDGWTPDDARQEARLLAGDT